jgi:hypothetical protein
VTVCGHIPEAPEATANALITLASIGEAGRYARGEHWVCQYHDVTALTRPLLDVLRDYR